MRILLISVLCLCTSSAHANLALFQGFDGTASDTWAFTPDPSRFNVPSADDIWTEVTSVGSGSNAISPFAGGQFWGMRDIDNSNGGQSGDLALDFATVSTAGFTDVVISFRYNAFAYDSGSGDDLGYRLTLDAGVPTDVTFFDPVGSNISSGGWLEQTIAVPDSVNSVSFSLLADQNGNDDWAGYDSVSITGIAAVPEPSAFLFGGVLCGVLGLRRARKSKSA